MMDSNPVVVSLSKQEMIRLEMICVDCDKDEALTFLKELRLRITQTVKGMVSHLDS
jgi:lactam utilization protein B